MVFWLAILFGVALAALAMRVGFYEMAAVFVHTLVSIYLGLFLTPALVTAIPAATDIPCGGVMMAAIVAVGTFLILHGLCFAILTGQFKVSFPKVLDMVAAGGLGFLTGFLIVAFFATLLTIAPLSRDLGVVSDNALKTHQSYVCWWCDRIHGLVRSAPSTHPTLDSIEQLRRIESHTPSHPVPVRSDPNAPAAHKPNG